MQCKDWGGGVGGGQGATGAWHSLCRGLAGCPVYHAHQKGVTGGEAEGAEQKVPGHR